MSHTEGKLVVYNAMRIRDERGLSVATTAISQKSDETSAANTRRLVACWNAFNSVPTEVIEQCADVNHLLPGFSGRINELTKERDEALEALRNLLLYANQGTCSHEETHRGGSIWEICDICGEKWADDEGGKPEWIEPGELEKARAILAKHQKGNDHAK